MNNLSILSAFLFGFLAFFSACTFPLVPSFLSFLLGVSFNELKDPVYTKKHRTYILTCVGAYILGSCLTLVLLGMTAGSVGYVLRNERYLIQQIGGVLVILFALYLLDIVHVDWLSRTFRLDTFIARLSQIKMQNKKFAIVLSFLIGAVFTLGWIPCLSAVLGGILVLAASSSSAWYGGLLLFIYSLGQNLPLIIIAFFFSTYLGYFRSISRHMKIINRISAILLLIFGIFLVAGSFSLVTQFFYQQIGLRILPIY